MRWLVVQPGPNFSVADVCNGWVAGLRQNGVTVLELNYSDRLSFYTGAHRKDIASGDWVRLADDSGAMMLASKGIETACYEFWPDVVMIVSGFYVPEAVYHMIHQRGHRIILLCTESPYEDDVQLRRAELADLVLLNDPTNLERFRAVNSATWFMPHAYDPAIHRRRPANPGYASDFCFVGTGYPSRVAFFEQVDWSGIDVAFGGNWEKLAASSPLFGFLAHDQDMCLPNIDTVDLYSNTRASANLYRREAHDGEHAAGWSMSPREVELAALGVFFLRESRGEGDDVLPMLPTFNTPGEFGEQLRWWLAHDDARAKAASAARDAVEERTFAHNAHLLLRKLYAAASV